MNPAAATVDFFTNDLLDSFLKNEGFFDIIIHYFLNLDFKMVVKINELFVF